MTDYKSVIILQKIKIKTAELSGAASRDLVDFSLVSWVAWYCIMRLNLIFFFFKN